VFLPSISKANNSTIRGATKEMEQNNRVLLESREHPAVLIFQVILVGITILAGYFLHLNILLLGVSIVVAIYVISLYLQTHAPIAIYDNGIEVAGFLRRVFVPWNEIDDIDHTFFELVVYSSSKKVKISLLRWRSNYRACVDMITIKTKFFDE
jgi:hypothetical protein